MASSADRAEFHRKYCLARNLRVSSAAFVFFAWCVVVSWHPFGTPAPESSIFVTVFDIFALFIVVMIGRAFTCARERALWITVIIQNLFWIAAGGIAGLKQAFNFRAIDRTLALICALLSLSLLVSAVRSNYVGRVSGT
jgi:hypothetical protein